MSDQQWEPGICNERSGFLFSHGCDRPVSQSCDLCQKPVCHDHSHLRETGTICKACAKLDMKQHKVHGERRVQRDNDWDNDPYFYSGYYYNGYGYYGPGYWGHSHHHRAMHDSNDFSEADGESVMRAGDEDFEGDMGES